MNVLLHWVPVMVGSAILIVVALILMAKVEREEREGEQGPADKAATRPAGGP